MVTCTHGGLIYKTLLAAGLEVRILYASGDCDMTPPPARFPDCFHCGGKGTVLEVSCSEGWSASCTRCGLRLSLRHHSMGAVRLAWDLHEVSYTHVRSYTEISGLL